jgi:NAD(P)-dependent dehydrogenase (short-subunit alcohol dehydrogenase family)
MSRAAAVPEQLVVLVTGGTGPAGRAVARRFLADGARVALNGSDPGRLATAAAELDAAAEKVLTVPGDLTEPVAAGAVVAAVEAEFGRVDVVAHLVGGWVGGTEVANLHREEVRRMLDQHLWTTLHVLQAVVPGMRARGFGRVVGVSSPFAATPGPRGASYAVAKAAEEVLLRTLAREAAADGVTANILVVRTLDDARARAAQPNARTAGWTTPDEVADAVAWLASPAAAAVNGARIPLDGRG